MRGAPGGEVFGQVFALAPRGKHIEDRVENLTHIDRSSAPATSCRRNEASDEHPLRVVQITGITKSAAIGGKAVFGLPHRLLPYESSSDRESQLTHPTQQVPGSALREESHRHPERCGL